MDKATYTKGIVGLFQTNNILLPILIPKISGTVVIIFVIFVNLLKVQTQQLVSNHYRIRSTETNSSSANK